MYHGSKTQHSAGFALLYAVIVIAVISSLGTVLSNLLVREAKLTATSRQSSKAYFHADAGAECALYWDVQEDHFPAPPNDASDEGDIDCSGVSNINVTPSDDGGDNRYRFSIDNGANGICASVSVLKQSNKTIIDSTGKDKCASATRVQRVLQTSY
jgi:hypothetical protein